MYIYDTSKSSPPVQVYNDAPTGTVRQQIAVVQDPYVVFDNQDELYVWDKSSRSISRLTDNDYMEQAPLIDGSRVAWSARGGADVYTATLVKSTPSYRALGPLHHQLRRLGQGRRLAQVGVEPRSPVARSPSSTRANGSDLEGVEDGDDDLDRRVLRLRQAGQAHLLPRQVRRRCGVRRQDLGIQAGAAARVYLSRPSGPKSITHGVAFTSTGYLKPRHTAGTKPVRIQCYRKVSGVYRLKKTYYAKVSNYSSYSKYKASVKLPDRGSWRIRAYYPTTTTNYSKVSTYRNITAK